MKRWRRVEDAELRALWRKLERKGLIYNGCTHVALTMKYGPANLKHKMGHGWYKLTATP